MVLENAAYSGTGATPITLEVSDGEVTASDELVVNVQDTTAPTAEAQLQPVFKTKRAKRGKAKKSKKTAKAKKAKGYIVHVECEDLCDAAPAAQATLDGLAVSDGDFVSNFTTIQIFTNALTDDTYFFYDHSLASSEPFTGTEFFIGFFSFANNGADEFFVDDIEVVRSWSE